VLDGATISVTAGADGLLFGGMVGASHQEPPQDAVVH